MTPVHRLADVPVRQVWPNEARDFTPWLAESPEVLAEALHMDLEMEGMEVPVGPFSADLVFRAIESDRRVVVENLLEASDHDHLGKMITYAAGLEAAYVVLITPQLRPEHRSALVWLNDVTKQDSGFFGIEVRTVTIADSPPGILLDVVVEPDDWARAAVSTANRELSDTQRRYMAWWAEFLDAFHRRFPGWSRATSPPSSNWISFPSGRSGVVYGVNFSRGLDGAGTSLRVELYLHRGNELWDHFARHRDEVDAVVGLPVSWEPMPDRGASRIAVYRLDSDPADTEAWDEYRRWSFDALERLRKALQPIIDEK